MRIIQLLRIIRVARALGPIQAALQKVHDSSST
jgi:hypothetical protein